MKVKMDETFIQSHKIKGNKKQCFYNQKLLLLEILRQMRNRYKFYQQLKHELVTITSPFPSQQQNYHKDHDSNYQTAKQILMSIPDDHDTPKFNLSDLRCNNGSQITRWNQQQRFLNANKENKTKPKKINKAKYRHISSENSFIENQYSQFNIAYSLKRELNKLNFPLKQKNLNSQQFRRSQFQKYSNKTRNQIKLDIIHSKHELTPAVTWKKKLQTEYNCENILKIKNENESYQRIKRKGFFTIDAQSQKDQALITNFIYTKQKAFFLKNKNFIKKRQNSIHLFNK